MEQQNLINDRILSYKHPKYSYVDISQIKIEDIEQIDIARCKDPTQTLESFYKDSSLKPNLLINGGLFYMKEGTPILTLYDEGKLYNEEAWLKTGIGIIGDKELQYGELRDGHNYRDFISAYPMFIIDKKANKITYATELNYRANRQILAWNSNFIFIISITGKGMNYSEIQTMLLNFKSEIGEEIEYAGNLDGGGSVRKLIDGEPVVTLISNRPVDNVLAIYLNPKPKKYLKGYRVQLGAFSIKANAENYCLEIQSLGQGVIDYRTAFVKFEMGYYRVQVGFFTNKNGANKVAQELRDKGYNTYIRYVEEAQE